MKLLAYVDRDSQEWDVIEKDGTNLARVHYPQLFGLEHDSFDAGTGRM